MNSEHDMYSHGLMIQHLKRRNEIENDQKLDKFVPYENHEEKNKVFKTNFRNMYYWQWMFTFILETAYNAIEFELEFKMEDVCPDLIHQKVYEKLVASFMSENSEELDKLFEEDFNYYLLTN